MIRRAVALALLALLALPAAAGAHARLVATEPQRGQTVAEQPSSVVFRFSEPVETTFGAVRVYDADAEPVDDAKLVDRPGHAIAIGLKPGLPDGTYTATYRVISSDGHPVSGGLVFSIGAPGAGPARSVDDLLGSSEAGPVTDAAFTVVRAVEYGAIAVAAGGLVFLLVCWPGGGAAYQRRIRRLLMGAAGAGFAAGALALVLQAATATGTTFWQALDRDVLGELLETRVGAAMGIRELAWLAFAAAGATAGSWTRLLRGVAAVALVVTPAYAGHAGNGEDPWLLVPMDVLHVAAMSVWLGGLVALLVALPAATRAAEPPERTRILAGALSRFSPLALGAVIVLVATGTVQSIGHLDAFGDLLDTAFGRAVLTKIGLLAGLVALGAVNRRRTLPRLRAAAAQGGTPGAAGRLVRRTLRAEVALVAVVLTVTGALVSYPPPASLAGQPVAERVALGPLQLEVTVDPAQIGPNELHLYLYRDAQIFDGAEEVRATLRLPDAGIGEIPVRLRKAGPGHFVADTLQIAPKGDWELTVAARVSEFDEHRASVEVPVR